MFMENSFSVLVFLINTAMGFMQKSHNFIVLMVSAMLSIDTWDTLANIASVLYDIVIK